VMPGSILYDYGDALRISGSSAAEDEQDLNKVHFVIDNFVAFTKGFISSMKDSITQCELSLLPFSIKLITMEIGMRFLTDYLNNDIYFAIHKKDHNLYRARTQFKLVSEIEYNIEKMNKIVYDIIREGV
ncbi:MAG TPA: mucin desulfatase, partial [Clostridia bacterium]|nr:mucin desulfatase [Clostridia bacterium]